MNYQLTQTGEQVQDILNQAPTTEETLQAEITRSTNKDDALELAIGNEKTRAEGVESNLQTAIGNEKTRAEGAEANLQTAIGNEKTRAELVEGALRTDVDGINAKIPTGASSENKLATESFVNSSISTNTADFKGTFNSLEQLETEVHDANANDYAFVISTDAAGNTAYNRYKYVEGTGWVFEYALNNSSFTSAQWAAINSAITSVLVAKLTGLPTATELTTQLNAIIDSVATEKSRAEGIESGLRTDVNANATAIGTEKTRAEGVEGNLSTAIGNEKTRAEAAELLLQQNINAEALLRGNADTALQTGIDGINAKIPAAASSSNQLADKAFVNSSIATNTATFRGTYDSIAALDEVTADNNDYAFVVATDTAGNTVYNRYKYVEGSGWVFEYALNNSSFTATQWAAVNSGITAALVTKLTGLPDNTALAAMFTAITSLIPAAATSDNKLVDYAQLVAGLATKQNTLTFDNVPVENSNNPVKSGGVYSAIATVTAAVVGLQSSKQDVLTFDQYPTAGSNNPVKSTGIYTAIENAVAPKANQTALDAAVVRISTNENDIAQLQAAYAALTESDIIVGALPASGQQINTIYRQPDPDHTPPQFYSDYMWNGTAWVLMATYDNAIDDVPTAGSNNLVKSGGVKKETSFLTDYGFEYGGLDINGNFISNTIRCRSKRVYFEGTGPKRFTYSVSPDLIPSSFYYAYKQDVPVKPIPDIVVENGIISFTADGTFDNIIVSFKHSDNSDISQSEIAASYVTAYTSLKDAIEKNVNSIKDINETIDFQKNVMFEYGGVSSVDGELVYNTIRIRTLPLYFVGYGIKRFKYSVPQGLIFTSGYCYIGTLAVKGLPDDFYVGNGVLSFTADETFDNIRLSFKHDGDSEISQSELDASYITTVDTVRDIEVGQLFINKKISLSYGGVGASGGQLVNATTRIRTPRIKVVGTGSRTQEIIILPSLRIKSWYAYLGETPVKQIPDASFSSNMLSFTADGTFDNIIVAFGYPNNDEIPVEVRDYCYIPNGETTLKEEVDDNLMVWKGKRCVAIGDSITWGFIPRNAAGYPGQLNSYAKIAAEKLGMSFFNYAVAGASVAVVSGRTSLCNIYSGMNDDADLIIVTGGTNDIRNGVQLGQMSDRNTTTYYGALHTLFQGLYTKYVGGVNSSKGKKRRIVAITPIKLLDSSKSHLPNTVENNANILQPNFDIWANALKEVAEFYSFPVLDFYNHSGINPHLDRTVVGTEEGYTGNYNPYITDGTHPTQEGQEIMSDILAGFLKTLK